MNYSYFPENYPVMPFMYWAQLHASMMPPNLPQKPEETVEIAPEEPVVKIQKTTEIVSTSQISKNPKPPKRSSKKNRKPKKIKKRDMSFSGKSQKQNRNYTSILCRTFLMYVAQYSQLEILINSIIQHFGISFDFQTFIKTFTQLFDLKKSYIRKELVEGVCASTNCDKEFSLIFRVLFRRFLKLQIFPTVFKSSKLTKKVKSKEAKFGKKVYETFFQSRKDEGIQKGLLGGESEKKGLQKERDDSEVKNEELGQQVKKQE